MRDTVPEAERSGNTQGAKCHPHREATLKPNTEPLSSERNPLLLSANSGHKFEMTSWELHFVVSMLSEITSPTSARLKLNSSSNWMALPSVAALGAGRIRQRKKERTKYLGSRGYRVIRFWNNDVTNNTPALACWCKC